MVGLPTKRAPGMSDHQIKDRWVTQTLRIILASALLTTSPMIASAADATQPNTLTEAEKKAGWRSLFDGKTTTGWRGYQMDKLPPGWEVIDGVLVRVRGGAGGKGA